jgi:5-methylcytosine-specific restriction protein B
MARLSNIPGLPAILAAADQWKRDCLLGNGSLLSSSQLWTIPNLASLDEHFVQHPLLGNETFLEKLRKQLEPAPAPVKQLGAEMLWLHLLFPSNITGAKKRENVLEVWSWSGTVLDPSHPLLELLNHGVGSAGIAYNNRRGIELAFAVQLSKGWKDEAVNASLAEDAWAFGNWVDSLPGGENHQFRHMILFLLFPDFYERISSGRQKKMIVSAFEAQASPPEMSAVITDQDSERVALDKKLLSIRKALERQYKDREIDFYGPPVDALWQKAAGAEDEMEGDDEVGEEAIPGRQVWIEKTLVKGRTDRQQGDHRLGKALWSPQKNKKGADIYRNMRSVREGDIVLHLIDNKQFVVDL